MINTGSEEFSLEKVEREREFFFEIRREGVPQENGRWKVRFGEGSRFN